MTDDQREIQCKLRVFQHGEKIGCVSTTCRYFGISLRVLINGVAPVGSAALAG